MGGGLVAILVAGLLGLVATAYAHVTLLRALADFTIRTYFPELGEPSKEVYVAWLKEVARRTAETGARVISKGEQ